MTQKISDVAAVAVSETQRVSTTDDGTDESDDSSSSVVENRVGSAGLPDQQRNDDVGTAAGVDVSVNSQLSRVSSSGARGQSLVILSEWFKLIGIA